MNGRFILLRLRNGCWQELLEYPANDLREAVALFAENRPNVFRRDKWAVVGASSPLSERTK